MKTLSLKEFIHEFKMDYYSDKWGHALLVHFDVCNEMYYRGFRVPRKWKFKPSPLSGDLRDKESYFFELFDGLREDDLINIGNFLHKLAGILEEKYSY